MSIEIIDDRATEKEGSLSHLEKHIAYLSNPTHPDHLGKVTILPPKIFNLNPPSTEQFLMAVTKSDSDYLNYREGGRGKRTGDMWGEAIYRTPHHTDLSDGERAKVERTMLSIKPGAPAFTQWHFNFIKGSWDLHVLTPTKSGDWPPRVILTSIYGAGKKHIVTAMLRLDDRLVFELNQHRPPHKQIVSKLARKRQKALEAIGEMPPLAEEIAKHTPQPVTRENLVAVVESLRHRVPRPPKGRARFLSVIYAGRKQTRREPIDELLVDIAEIQEEIRAASLGDSESPSSPSKTNPPPAPPELNVPATPPGRNSRTTPREHRRNDDPDPPGIT